LKIIQNQVFSMDIHQTPPQFIYLNDLMYEKKFTKWAICTFIEVYIINYNYWFWSNVEDTIALLIYKFNQSIYHNEFEMNEKKNRIKLILKII